MKKKVITKYCGTGRRKSSVARVSLVKGKGSITINNRDISNYVPYETSIINLKQPLVVTGNDDKYDISVNVYGGGIMGQVDAIRLGIARALVEAGNDKQILKHVGLLTRDSRVKERKKYGLKGARRAPQFSKR